MRGVLPCEGLLLKGYVWDFDLGFGYLVWDLVFATLFYWITSLVKQTKTEASRERVRNEMVCDSKYMHAFFFFIVNFDLSSS